MNALEGTVVVTGGASGIGQALAVEAARRGARVATLDVSDGAATLETIRSAGGEAEHFVVDVSDDAAVAAVADQVVARFGGVSHVLANAGTGTAGTIEQTSWEEFHRVLGVNLYGTFHTVRHFMPHVRRTAAEGRPAAVMVMGSEHALAVPPAPAIAAYTISKHALLGLAGVLRQEVADSGVTVTLVAPDWTLSPAIQGYLDTDPPEASFIRAVAQTTEYVAGVAWDAIQAGTFLAPTNVHSTDLVLGRTDEIRAAFETLNAGAH